MTDFINSKKFDDLAQKLNTINDASPAPSVLEKTFDISPGSTPKFIDKVGEHNPIANTLTNPDTGEIMTREVNADEKAISEEERIEDLQIDGRLGEIYNNAITAFNNHADLAENADPRFSARNGEVAAQFLKIALDSTGSKIDAKYKRNKIKIASKNMGPTSVQNNLVVADRNSLLKSLFSKDFEQTIKQEFTHNE